MVCYAGETSSGGHENHFPESDTKTDTVASSSILVPKVAAGDKRAPVQDTSYLLTDAIVNRSIVPANETFVAKRQRIDNYKGASVYDVLNILSNIAHPEVVKIESASREDADTFINQPLTSAKPDFTCGSYPDNVTAHNAVVNFTELRPVPNTALNAGNAFSSNEIDAITASNVPTSTFVAPAVDEIKGASHEDAGTFIVAITYLQRPRLHS